MIVVVGGVKGGSGKTTLATNLTVLRASTGKKVLLVDADEQRSASDWVDQRENSKIKSNWTTIQLSGMSTHKQLEKLKSSYDDIIVDVGGRATTSLSSSLMVADIFLTPFKPRSLDIWTIGVVRNLISNICVFNPKLKSFGIINQADAQGTDTKDAILAISFDDIICAPFSIGNRKAFANAASLGLGVVELKKVDRKSCNELLQLYSFIYGEECTF